MLHPSLGYSQQAPPPPSGRGPYGPYGCHQHSTSQPRAHSKNESRGHGYAGWHPSMHPGNQPQRQWDDHMFHGQTRDDTNRGGNARQVLDYHLYAPKFTNHGPGMEPGVQPTQQGPSRFPNARLREPIPQGFGARGVPYRNQPSQQFDQPAGTDRERINQFNSAIDSMHLPEDLQRPVATRDLMKSDFASSEEQRSADSAQASQFLTERQFSVTGMDGNFLLGANNLDDVYY